MDVEKKQVDIKEVSPVGEVKMLAAVQEYVNTLGEQWSEVKEDSWWKSGFFQASQFLMRCLDGLIVFVDDLIPDGADKKATVLNAMNALYDYVVREAVPIWLRPFSNKIKQFIIYTVVSTAIDFMVEKYRAGEWNKEVDDDQEEISEEKQEVAGSEDQSTT